MPRLETGLDTTGLGVSSQRSDHMGAGAFHIFTVYPARNSLSPGVGPLKRLPTEVPEPRRLL